MNYLTAHFALVDRGGLREGETVLVHGASGGVGTADHPGGQRLRGPHDRRRLHAREGSRSPAAAGADETVLLDGFKDAALELTAGRGVDVVVDVVGGDVFLDSLRCLAPQGRLLVVGFAAGQGIPEVKVNRLLLNNIDVRGVNWGGLRDEGRPATCSEQWAALLPLIEAGRDRPTDRRDVRPRRASGAPSRTWTTAAPSASRWSGSVSLGDLELDLVGCVAGLLGGDVDLVLAHLREGQLALAVALGLAGLLVAVPLGLDRRVLDRPRRRR